MKNTIKAWDLNPTTWPTEASFSQKLIHLVRYAMLAPSGHNTQPWRFRISGDGVTLYADRSRSLPIVDPDDRELIISCGCALSFLKVAAHYFGYHAKIQEFPDPLDSDCLATVQLTPDLSLKNEVQDLFMAITRRHTNRFPFESRPVSADLLQGFQGVVQGHKAGLRIVEDSEQRLQLAALITEGDRRQGADPEFRKELAAWVRSNYTHHRDGMPGYGFGIGNVASLLGSFFIRTVDWGKSQGKKDSHLALNAPVLAVLESETDHPQAWLQTGQALGHLLLRITAAGLAASFLNQPIEIPALRSQLQELLKTEQFPQIILRLGYGKTVQPIPRRSVDEILAP